MFGSDYAETLKDGKVLFKSLYSKLKNKGFNETFLRMWSYYLSYCEGGLDQEILM